MSCIIIYIYECNTPKPLHQLYQMNFCIKTVCITTYTDYIYIYMYCLYIFCKELFMRGTMHTFLVPKTGEVGLKNVCVHVGKQKMLLFMQMFHAVANVSCRCAS